MNHQLTDTGWAQVVPRRVLPPEMERALRMDCVRVQRARDLKQDLVEWHWHESCRLVDEMQRDGALLREMRGIVNIQGVFNYTE
jgi:hypothetical protein